MILTALTPGWVVYSDYFDGITHKFYSDPWGSAIPGIDHTYEPFDSEPFVSVDDVDADQGEQIQSNYEPSSAPSAIPTMEPTLTPTMAPCNLNKQYL